MPITLLALSTFAIGTTKFIIMGLLPEVTGDLAVSLPDAGWLISGYALGVAIGAPIMTIVTARLPRKTCLALLMVIFIIGNVLCALAYSYGLLIIARVVTALCHGAFFDIDAVVAAGLVPPNCVASAVALMFTGLMLANVLGVPSGTWLGQLFGCRATFWCVSLLAAAAFAIDDGIFRRGHVYLIQLYRAAVVAGDAYQRSGSELDAVFDWLRFNGGQFVGGGSPIGGCRWRLS